MDEFGSYFHAFHSMKRGLSVIMVLMAIIEVKAQSETQSFASLTLPLTAEAAALGSVNVSRADYNVNFFQNNIALSSDTLDGWASANYLFYFAGTGLSSFGYQHNFDKIGILNFGVNHMSLGTLQGYDIFGSPTGTFSSGETTVTIGKAKQVDLFRFGINIKGVFSNLAGYRASALLLDMGGAFVHPTKDLSIGLVIKNVGVVLNEYSPTSSSTLPFDVQAGVSYKPEHMPLRFSATAFNLSNYKTPYQDGLTVSQQHNTLDKVTSHLTFGAELLVHKNVDILLGYNFLRHQELKLEGAGGGSGISVGAVVKVRHLHFAFSRSGYVTGGAYQVSLNVNTKRFLIRR